MPHPRRVHDSRVLGLFGRLLHSPNLWHLNRHSVSRAVGLGLFWALIPMPFQSIPAAACAIGMRANVGITLVLVWLSNPLTMPPIMYACYQIGRVMLGRGPRDTRFAWTWESIRANLDEIWLPLGVGSIAAAVILAGAGYLLVQWAWRWNLRRRWAKRGHDRRALRHDK